MKTYLPLLMLMFVACAGPTSPSATSTPLAATSGPLPTPPPALNPDIEIELVMVQQAAQVLNCSPGTAIAADIFGFICEAGEGHSTAAQLTRFADEAAARAAFDTERADRPTQCFHGYAAAAWEAAADTGKHRLQVWLASDWLIVVDAFDAADPPTAPLPLDVTEALYTTADVNGFLPAVVPGENACP